MRLDGVDVGGGQDLLRLVPGGAAESALPARALVAGTRLGVGDDRGIGRHWVVGVSLLGGPPEVEERAADVGVLHAQRAVDVPGIGDAPLAAARLVRGHVAANRRVVERLHFPGDDAVLDVDVPAARAGAVDAVRAAHRLVVGPAAPVVVFPQPLFGSKQILNPRHRFLPSGSSALSAPQRSSSSALSVPAQQAGAHTGVAVSVEEPHPCQEEERPGAAEQGHRRG